MLVATAFRAADLVTRPRFEPGALVVIAALTAAYAIGVRRATRGGGRWPAARSGAFAAAVVLLLVATTSGLASVGRANLTVHAVADMTLLMAAPVFLVLSGPLGLAREATTEGTRARIEAVLSSRPVRVLTHPVTTWIPFGAALFVLYFTSLLATSVHHAAVAQLVSLGLLASGVLFVWPVLNPDPAPGRVTPFVGMVDLLLLLP
ncbi:MAG: cytochrome c oxidase assembly protein, partial [Acidimicrobiales bacterium]